jgi:ABC-type phosphate/phosphonate transport system substrate-binding protein
MRKESIMVEKKKVKKSTSNATMHVKNAAQVAKGQAKVTSGNGLGTDYRKYIGSLYDSR